MEIWSSKDYFFLAIFHVTNFERSSGLEVAKTPKGYFGIVLRKILLAPIRSVEALFLRLAIFLRYFGFLIIYLAYDAVSVQPSGYLAMTMGELESYRSIQHWAHFGVLALPLALWAITNEMRFAREISLRNALGQKVEQVEVDLKKARAVLLKVAIALVGLLIFDFLPYFLDHLNMSI
jgi:hypothetical protein